MALDAEADQAEAGYKGQGPHEDGDRSAPTPARSRQRLFRRAGPALVIFSARGIAHR